MSSILDQHNNTFASDPSNQVAFAALEEHFFMAGNWEKLIATYERRLTAPEFSSSPLTAVPLSFRIAQVCEERLLDLDRAIESYWKVAKIDPTHRPTLRQLRQIYTGRDQWDMVLQISEMEGQLPMEPHEKANFLAELGNIWNGKLNDPSEALNQYGNALEIVPDHMVALTGLAKVHQGLGHHQQAADAWERLSNRLRGPDRAPVLVALGDILTSHLGKSEQAVDCFQRALQDDPRCAKAVESLSATATDLEDWPLVVELYERRFDIAAGARKRAKIAVEAGRLTLEKLDDTQAARMWFDRALQLVNEDISIFEGIAELERRTGNDEALRCALDKVIQLAGDHVPASVLLETADLYSEAGQEDHAVALLRRAQAAAPDDSLIAETLSDSLGRLGQHEELVQVLERRAALIENDDQAKSEIHAEIGRIQLEDLSDKDAAKASLAISFELDANTHGVAAQLEPLYRKDENWDALRALLDSASRSGSSAKRAHSLASLGEVNEQHFENTEAASAAYEAALAIEPECIAAHQGVARILHASGDQGKLLEVCEREAAITTDRGRLTELVWTIVPLLEAEEEHKEERTEDALRWAEKLYALTPDDRKTLETVVRLRAATERSEQLQEPLERLDRTLTGAEQATNRRRLATLHLDAGRTDEAIQWFEQSLVVEGDHVASLQSLKTLYSDNRDFDAQARIMRRLTDVLPSDEATAELHALSRLLVDQMADIDGAVETLERLLQLPEDQCPDAVALELEDLLERLGRFEELAERLAIRRSSLDDTDSTTNELDTKRASLLLDNLGNYEEAARLFRTLRERDQGNTLATKGLEQALRLGQDIDGLVDLLEDIASRETDATAKAKYNLERATLLEDSLGAFDEARELFTEIATQDEVPEARREANDRLEELLVRCGDWRALRERMEDRIGGGNHDDDLLLHEELARLCRDRLHDQDGCISHLEAAGALAPERVATWQSLAILYTELDRQNDLLRVLEQELALELDCERETSLRARAGRLATQSSDNHSSAGEHYERLLELEPANAEASEFLLDFYERGDKHADMARLLRTRLDANVAANDSSPTAVASVLSLRLRVAAIEESKLNDLEAAVEALLPAIAEVGPCAAVATPLADLYLRLEQRENFIALCEKAAAHTDVAAERSSWMLQAADALHKLGSDQKAVTAYEAVLNINPEALDAQAALRTLHRELGNAAPLVELLKREVGRNTGDAATAVRLELATQLREPLGQLEEALEVFNQILEHDPQHPEAFVSALSLSQDLDRHADVKRLIESCLPASSVPSIKAEMLEQLGDLEAGPLADSARALGRYRESLALDPSRKQCRSNITRLLTGLGRWSELLDSLFVESQSCEAGERITIIENAIEIATREVSLDASLPWLERLRVESKNDPEPFARMAEVHRQANRPDALLRTLEAQLPLRSDTATQHALYCEMAETLAGPLSSPGRAAGALEQALAITPADPEVLEKLAGIYCALGRHADRINIIEKQILLCADDPSRLASLHRNAATLWRDALASPEKATLHLLHTIDLCPPASPDLVGLTRELQQTLQTCGQIDGWARAAESELKLLEAESTHETDARRIALHVSLASTYESDLARPARALGHMLALLDTWEGVESLSTEQIDTTEKALIEHLRREQNTVALAQRLEGRLTRIGGSVSEWLELARLQRERLYRPSAARNSYRQVLELEPHCLDAIRGLHKTAEALRDWSGVAESIDLELAVSNDIDVDDACTLLRKLGSTAWKQLSGDQALDRAVKAYCAILDRMPEDLTSVHALQEIEEQRAGHAAAIEHYEREATLLGDTEPERRQFVWLRVGELARDNLSEPSRAIEAFAAAAEVASLPLARLREWAELYRGAEDWERFAQTYGQWCDAPNTAAGCQDLLTLSAVLVDLAREDEALERAEMAIKADRSRAEAWECAAGLCELHGESSRAAEHLAEAAELRDADVAISHLIKAAQLVETDDAERAAKWLRRGTDHDPASQETQARLAVVSERLEAWEDASKAATMALDTEASRDTLPDDLLLNATMAGARSAWKAKDHEKATQLYSAAREIDAENTEALDSLARLLHEVGDVRGARDVIVDRHKIAGDNEALSAQLAILAEAQVLDGEDDTAIATFKRAIEAEPTLATAHDGMVSIYERTDDPAAAIAALKLWVGVLEDPTIKSSQLYRAARLQQSIEETDAAIQSLHASTSADTSNGSAWSMLADLLIRLDRPDEALEAATKALEHVAESDPLNVARLSYIRGCALEQGGDTDIAGVAYGSVLKNDPTHSEAALALARILRNSGEWQGAADTLREYLEHHPDPMQPTLANVFYERGQLLAGPLEQVEEAIRCYERATLLDPDFTKAVEPLANLLSYIPKRWSEAVHQHSVLLAGDPSRELSIRSLMKICDTRNDRTGQQRGLAILRAIGVTNDDEFASANSQLGFMLATSAELENPHWERLREMLAQGATEISGALADEIASNSKANATATNAEGRAFWESMRDAEGALSVPGFESLPTELIGQAVAQIVAMVLDAPRPDIDAALSEKLESTIGRWTRRKLRKVLEGTEASDLEGICWEDWRTALRGLAGRVTLDENNGNLRSALVALSSLPEDARADEVSDDADISDRIRSSYAACGLLREVTQAWCGEIETP